ncbi:DUF4855 domain-containing protein [Paenibacillus sp. KQZ6P-2]|uniref:DUF4855 domain-containing protein n=2 Tax=Paenibacillus mangrovi TaxID=2931978 RepID=A0A9X1WMU0_9BACL|nr:DUF4855 domain-containing protein [Paenibacillus mangrovi]MCJ8012172.1 DUF4855 domain-containing protein [Paenibacillus mangrovi]
MPANAYVPPGTDISNGAKNILLLYTGYYDPANYNGQQVGVYEKEKFKPYVSHLNQNDEPDDYFFDTFLFLGIKSPYGGVTGGRYYGSPDTHPGQKQDWQWFLDRVFTQNQQLDALNQAVKEANQKLNQPDHKVLVYMMLPFPDSQSTNFGDIDGSGTSLDFSSLEAREKAIKWYMDQFMSRFNDANYQNLKLAGFYWTEEDLNTSIPGETESVKYTSDYAHSFGLKLGWIPYRGAMNYTNGNKYGFDWTCIQPNRYFDTSSTYSRIKEIAKTADSSDEGIEIEFDQTVLGDKWYRQALMDYLIGGVESGYMKNSLLAYYQDVYGVYDLYYSANPIGKKLYNDIYHFTKGDFQLPATGNIKGRVVNIKGEPIQNVEVTHGDKVVTTDEYGNYEFDNLYAMGQDFSVADIGDKIYKSTKFSVDIQAGQTIMRDIVLENGILEGKVGGTVDHSVYSNLSAGIIPEVSMPAGGDDRELQRETNLMPVLTDGIYGNGNWDTDRDHYVDFHGNTRRDLYINLGQTSTVKEIGFRALLSDEAGIRLPKSMDVSISNDGGKSWGLLGSITDNMVTLIDAAHDVYEYHLSDLNFQANVIKISFDVAPWVFSDEVKVMGSHGVIDGATPPPVNNEIIKAPNYAMSIEPDIEEFSIGQTGKITVKDLKHTDDSGKPIIINNAIFSSSNPDIVKINSDGNITALSGGSAMIYASVNGIQVESKLINVSVTDHTPPATSASVAGEIGKNGWYKSKVAVALSAEDAESGVAETYSSMDGKEWMKGNAVAIEADGMHTLQYYSKDSAGNQEQTKSMVVKIDQTAPVIDAALPETVYSTDAVSLRISISDATSGVDQTVIKLDGVEVSAPIEREPFTLSVGDHIVEIAAMDLAGNEVVRQFTFRVDLDIDHLDEVLNLGYDKGWITDRGILNSLMASVRKVQEQQGDANQVNQGLNALRNKISAQSGKHIDRTLADYMLAAIDRLMQNSH